jgi:hypothetical protein
MTKNLKIKSIARGKSMTLALGLCLLLASMSFGVNSNHEVQYNPHRNMTIEEFCLVRSDTPVFLLDFLDMGHRSTRDESGLQYLTAKHRSDNGVFSETGYTSETKLKKHKRKLGFILEAGVATITGGNYGSSFAYGGGFYAHLSRKIGLEFLLGRYSISANEDLGGLGPGTLNTTPLLISGHLRFPMGSITPYVLVGVGFYFYHFEPAEKAEHHGEHQEEHQDKEVVDRFAPHLGGGLALRISHKLDFTVELKYGLAKTWVQERGAVHVEPAEQDIFNLYSLVLAAGIRYFF